FYTTDRHPTKSTLFPYTTLFRSKTEQPTWMAKPYTSPKFSRTRQKKSLFIGLKAKSLIPPLPRLPLQIISAPTKPQKGSAWGLRDRKSTRLNSSHVKISYAVFCL